MGTQHVSETLVGYQQMTSKGTMFFRERCSSNERCEVCWRSFVSCRGLCHLTAVADAFVVTDLGYG